MFGFLNVHKPPGPTSHDVVVCVRRRLPRKTKVGHAGTLDPFAQGVLVVCVGPATRLAGYVQAQPKRYAAEITLGATSSTDDPDGDIEARPRTGPPAEPDVREVIGRFVGEIEQVPPAHSAIHVAGRRAYELARAGQAPALAPRRVSIHGLDLVGYAWPLLTIDVRCGSGTYLRALARDIGEALGVGGYCSALTRTGVGTFELSAAVPLDELNPQWHLLPPLVAVEALPKAVVNPEEQRRISMGQSVRPATPVEDAEEVAVLGTARGLVAIATVHSGELRPTKVFSDL